MQVVCLDLEGVLVPEIWIAFAEKVGVEALKRTTRDEPDYDALMRYRLDILGEYGFTLKQIQEVIETLSPLSGALEFLNKLRSTHELVILSDTFREFADPLMKQLGYPTLFCHELKVDEDGTISDYCLRIAEHKRKTVQYLQKLNFEVIAAGDSYNDLGMLKTAEHCIFFRPPHSLAADYPEVPIAKEFHELLSLIEDCSS
ncbi:MAG: bifunctional phosphoserine phosphatase/homoserine phosphotransferase ThrH [Opitutae bacterium]|nr:bifunctional phosphoserine phosphatase/homoserine phosphotransferase ThrH [Opitutae bacterium]|tara:strand:- start:3575 stop:4177 length:603 start_codon:yes stop_codon:yes gene_type:complete